MCHFTLDTFASFVKSQFIASLEPIAIFGCGLFKPASFCDFKVRRVVALIPTFAILLNSTVLCPQIGFCRDPVIVPAPDAAFATRVLKDRPPISPRHSAGVSDQPPLRVLVFTDMHLDFDYMEGKSSVCDNGLCCRRSSPDTNDPKYRAGPFGDARCDLPNATMESFVYQVAKLNPDVVLWLGDNPPHNMYEQRKETQASYFQHVARLIKRKYPGKVFAVLGNHDSFPEAQFDSREHYREHQWLTEAYSGEMDTWLDPAARALMSKYGYYSQLVPGTKLKVIALNTFLMDFNNVYLWGNATNPMDSMGWLERELAASEINGESVILIGHIASQSNSGVYSWTFRYTTLIERYANIVKGQFFGHVHNDLFFVTRSYLNRSQPIAVTHVLPALTTAPNPSFRMYYVDRESYELIDYDQYRLYIAEANRLRRADWKVAYRFLSYFNVPDMSPRSFALVISRMEADLSYFKRVFKMYTNEEWEGPPDEAHRQKLLCSFKTWNMYEHRECMSKCMGESTYRSYYFPNEHVIPDWSFAVPMDDSK